MPHQLERPSQAASRLVRFLRRYLSNNAYRMTEGDYYPARVFTEASRWVWDNQDAGKFFLLVDSFDPHEPWDPPDYYRRLYDPEDDVTNVIHSLYAPWQGRMTAREVTRIQANYAGEVTMVDRWFGHFIETLHLCGRLDDTVVALITDHGHSLGLDPGDKGLISKQGHPMTHGVADLVMMIRDPTGTGAGTMCDALCYNHDLTRTLMARVGVQPQQEMDGIDLWPIVQSNGQGREHVTVAWGPLVSVITDEWWFNANIWGEAPLLYAVDHDRDLEHSLADEYPEVCERLRLLAVEDAGGVIPKAFLQYRDKPGCTPYLE
jgi:arylsulfatase A-like enzyme